MKSTISQKEKSPMRIAFLNDTDGRENIGCRLTSGRMKSVLMEVATEKSVELDLYSCPWLFRRHPTTRSPALISSLFRGQFFINLDVLRELSEIEYGTEALNAVQASDAVIYQPEGSISDNHDSFRILRQLCLPLYAALAYKKPLGIINGTFPLFSDNRRELIQSMIEIASYSCLRDELSAKFYGCNFGPDAAVTWPGEQVGEKGSRNYALITTAAHVSKADDLNFARKALEFCREHSLRPLIFTKAWERLAVLRPDVEAMGGQFRETASLDEAEALLRNCRLHIGGRYHVALFCITKGIPSFLVISNTHKNKWLSEAFSGIELIDHRQDNPFSGIVPELVAEPGVLTSDVQRHSKLTYYQANKLINKLTSSLGGDVSNKLGRSIGDSQFDVVAVAWERVRRDIRRSYFRSVAKQVRRSVIEKLYSTAKKESF